MLITILIGCGLMVATTFVHTGAMLLAIRTLRIGKHFSRWRQGGRWARGFVVAMVVVVMFLASFVEATGWAAVFYFTDRIETMEEAIYFSMVTYTTLGYGDVVLEEGDRVLATIEAANGVIMFGWTTAILVSVIGSVFARESMLDGE